MQDFSVPAKACEHGHPRLPGSRETSSAAVYETRQAWYSPKKFNYQSPFSYPTGFTGSIGFTFLFLSFLKKLRKKNPAMRER
jgi:hypothetical protein